jgi:hypothetical protein
MPKQTKAEWVAQGEAAVVALLEREHAVVWPAEVVAKLSDGPGRVDPHHLTTAVNNLTFGLTIESVAAPTRGGGQISVLALVDRSGRQRAFEDATARKRLLYARYLNWSSRYYGRAGERAVHGRAAGRLSPLRAWPGPGQHDLRPGGPDRPARQRWYPPAR